MICDCGNEIKNVNKLTKLEAEWTEFDGCDKCKGFIEEEAVEEVVEEKAVVFEGKRKSRF